MTTVEVSKPASKYTTVTKTNTISTIDKSTGSNVLEIHDQDMWFENDNLIMKSEKVGEFKKSDDLYVGSNSDLKELKLLFEKVGLTAINKV